MQGNRPVWIVNHLNRPPRNREAVKNWLSALPYRRYTVGMTTPNRPWLRPAVEYGPLVIFFIAYLKFGLMAATGALMAASAVAIAASYIMERRVPVVTVATAVVVMIFGGLTLYFDDERFIKLKPTIIQGLFAVVLIGGLILDKPLLKPLLSGAWQLTDQGWRILTLRFGIFFAVMAVINEIVWRTQTTDFWVNYKIFGAIVLTIAFTACQGRLIMRCQIDSKEN